MLAALLLPAQEEFAPGRIIDPIAIVHDPSQSYALYLPTGYRASQRWPVLYGFDPGGCGRVPVALFKQAAEKHGWILVGSNSSRNGPWEMVISAARALWKDTRARLAIDDGRVYAAGFSGGARAACGLGRMLSIRLAGVVSCGAGLPEWLEPSDMAAVPWFGTVGLRDFNYQEMQTLERALRRQGSPCLLRVFQGRHSWPPVKLAEEAVAWLKGQPAPPSILE